MESQPNGPTPTSENRERANESLHSQIKQRKEAADLSRGLERIQRNLSETDYYSKDILSASSSVILLGDYGNVQRFTQDYVLNRIYSTSGFVDVDGNPLTVERVRKVAAVHPEERPVIKLVGGRGNSADVNFYAGKDKTNFGIWLHGYEENLRSEVLNNLKDVPAYQWTSSIVQEISDRRGEILEHKGVYRLDLGNWSTGNFNEDLAYFLNNYEFSPRFGWTPQEVESLLRGEKDFREKASVAETTDGSGNKWLEFKMRRFDGATLALRKEELGVRVALLVDTDELRGRNDKDKFIDSQTAKDLFEVMEKLELEPSDKTLNDLTEGSLGFGHYNDRYGNGYSDLSRLLAYTYRESLWIDEIFNIQGRTITPDEFREASKDVSEPAKLLVEQIAAIAQGKAEASVVTKFSDESIRAGSCKDSEVYFAGGFYDGKCFREGNFICKTGFGADTKMNIEPVTDGNIVFPPGYLFRVSSSGQLEPLRATMYCFDNSGAKDAFGEQYEECLQNEARLPYAIDRFREGWNVPVGRSYR